MNRPPESSLERETAEIRERFACDCAEARPTRRTLSSGAVAVWLQCVTCGRGLRAVKKEGHKLDALPAYDEHKYADRLRLQHEAQQAAWTRHVEALNAGRVEQDAAWWERYNAYLRSPKWQRLRQLVLERDKHTCQACLTHRATQVHHQSYELFNRTGASAAFECVSVCDRCHEKIHPHMQDAA